MATNEEYSRIARSMETVIRLVNKDYVHRDNIIFALGQLDSHVNVLTPYDPLWKWWLTFSSFEFAMSVRPKRIPS